MVVKMLTFFLGDEVFAVDAMKVEKVMKYEKPTRIPNVADYIEGIINLMGEVIPIVNLRKKFLMPDVDDKWKTKIIVVKLESGKKIGFLVDDVKEVLNITEDVIEEPPTHVGGMSNIKFIFGVVKMEGQMVLILDVDQILTAEERLSLANI